LIPIIHSSYDRPRSGDIVDGPQSVSATARSLKSAKRKRDSAQPQKNRRYSSKRH